MKGPMKKSTNRVHRNDPTKAASLQRKSKIGNPAEDDPFAAPANDRFQTCLCIYDRKRRKPVQKVSLTDEECFAVQTLCLNPEFKDKTSGDVIAEALRAKLRHSELRQAVAEVDSAKNDVFALLHLLRAHTENQAQCLDWDKDFDDKMSAGIGQLVNTTAEFLRDSVEALFFALEPRPAAQGGAR
jgi:hypothetical protein